MAKKYQRLNSGLLVPSEETRPWWAGKYHPSSNRFALIRRGGSLIRGSGGALSNNPDCCCEPSASCGYCSDPPYYYQVSISGVTNRDCSNCDEINGVHILEFCAASPNCVWRKLFDYECAPPTYVVVQIGLHLMPSGVPGYILVLVVLDPALNCGNISTAYTGWSALVATPVDCNFNELSLAWIGKAFFACYVNTASVLVTAL